MSINLRNNMMGDFSLVLPRKEGRNAMPVNVRSGESITLDGDDFRDLTKKDAKTGGPSVVQVMIDKKMLEVVDSPDAKPAQDVVTKTSEAKKPAELANPSQPGAKVEVKTEAVETVVADSPKGGRKK